MSDLPPHGMPGRPTGAEARIAEAAVEDTGASPRRRVGFGFVAVFALAYLGVWMAFLAVPFVSMAVKVAQVDPEGRTGTLALVLGVGGLFSILANPFFGRLSDRTTSRFGMRRPWMLAGLAITIFGLFLIAIAQGVAVIVVGWCVMSVGVGALQASIVALIPDHVPVEQRGRVSGILGLCIPLGAIGGTFIAQAVSASTALMLLAPSAVTVVTVLLLVAVLKNDRRLSPEQARNLPRYGLREFLGSFWLSPRRYPGFSWAWLSRFLVFMAVATLVVYQPYYLADHLGISLERVPQLVFLGVLVHYAGQMLMAPPAGWLSDRVGRRKVFVLSSAVLYAFGLLFVAFAGSFEVFLVGMAITGLAEGIYLAVDLALVADVLPHPDDAAKDLGVFNIANALPQSLAPAVAPIFLAIPLFSSGDEGNYVALFIASALFALFSALAIRPVKGVR